MSRARNGKRRRAFLADSEELNPMDSVSNLSDVMLILAVGIMLSLILHWNVKIEDSNAENADSGSQNSAVTFQGDDLLDQDEIPENLKHMGEVFYDPESGTYYILQESAGGSAE